MFKAKPFLLFIKLTMCVSILFAQEADLAPAKTNRFHLGVNFGTGHAEARSFMGQRISDFGYSTLTSMEAISFDIGYDLNERFLLVGGFAGQNLSLSYFINDMAYRYNGGRVVFPLGIRWSLGPETSPAKIIMGLSGYYSFDSDISLTSDDGDGFEATNAFNGFGMWTTIGFSYALTKDTGFSMSINALSDFTGNILRLNSGFLSFGFYVKPF